MQTCNKRKESLSIKLKINEISASGKRSVHNLTYGPIGFESRVHEFRIYSINYLKNKLTIPVPKFRKWEVSILVKILIGRPKVFVFTSLNIS